MLPLRWTEQAVEHLGGIADFISASSPVYAEGVIHRIESRLQLLREQPAMGKATPAMPDPSVRELVVSPYRVFYRVLPDCIEILAILHGRREGPGAPAA
jgi:toxin ParE1/3/4